MPNAADNLEEEEEDKENEFYWAYMLLFFIAYIPQKKYAFGFIVYQKR